jgi:hypothetical protein
MKARSIFSAATLLLVFVWTGCNEKTPGEHQEAASQTHDASQTTEAGQAAASDAASKTAEAGQANGTEVALAGMLGCGHCNYHVATSCAAALKTASGDVYLIDNAGSDSELFQKRYDGIQVTVNGQVSEKDDVKHIAMASYAIQ